jgi:hypothetical protein
MSLDQPIAALQAHLLGGADFEVAGSDHATGVGYCPTTNGSAPVWSVWACVTST